MDVFGRYSKPGPRYTSYPTAIEFTDSLKYEDVLPLFRLNSGPISLYIHLPFCRSACYFCGCNILFTSKDEKKDRYIDYLKKEIDILSKYLDTKREVVQLHFGGGTPTFFDENQLDKIIKLLKSKFINFSDSAEISCEIDPRHITDGQMRVLSENGFNRVSFGVQDFDTKVQEAVHRVQSFDITKNSVELAKKYNMKSINIDLIYGLPFQSLNTFKETLTLATKLNPDRFAIFNYAHVPWLKKTMRKIDETTLPLPSEKLKILQYTIEYLTTNGYKMVGMDHFAKPDDELFLAIEKNELHRNFQGYTTKGGAELIGIGLTSIGEFGSAYIQNTKDINEYEELIDSGRLPYHRGIKLTRDDLIRKRVIMDLMSNFKLDIKSVEKDLDINFKGYFRNELKGLEEFITDGIITVTDDWIEANEIGMMLIRNIAMVFDAYMYKFDNKKVFSKTV